MPVIFERKDATLTVRIDARSRYGLDLLSRIKRRSISEIVVSELKEILDKELPASRIEGAEVPLLDAAWDVFGPDRVVKLALYAPELLTEDEQKIWRVISENQSYVPRRGKPDFAAIRRDWMRIQKKVREYGSL